MKEPFWTKRHDYADDADGLQQLVEVINAKGDAGELNEILSEDESIGSQSDAESDRLKP